MVRVSKVRAGSIAEELEIVPGTELLSVNGRELRDFATAIRGNRAHGATPEDAAIALEAAERARAALAAHVG